MKNYILTLTLAILFTGCSTKIPNTPGSNNISDANALNGDTISIEENNYGNEGLINSSKDGFISAYFDFNEYSVSKSMSKNISVASSANYKIKIGGNCDSFGTDEYNYALGLKRAKSVKDALVDGGVSSSRIVLVSYGESNPACNKFTEKCYSSNRRADLSFIK